MQICLRNMSYACEPFLLLYLISLAKLDFFLAILWPSVYFILYSNYLIVPFLRVFLSFDFSWEKKRMSGSLNTIHFSKPFPRKMKPCLPAGQTWWCFVLPKAYLMLITCVCLTPPSLHCRLSKERDCFLSNLVCACIVTGNRIIHVEVA